MAIISVGDVVFEPIEEDEEPETVVLEEPVHHREKGGCSFSDGSPPRGAGPPKDGREV
jgi:hypothetical protein